MSYCRSPLTRFVNRHQAGITWLVSTVLPSVAAALVFGWMIAAPLLHLGGSAESGPVAGAAMSYHSSPTPYQQERQQDAPGPRIVASGAGLGAVEDGL